MDVGSLKRWAKDNVGGAVVTVLTGGAVTFLANNLEDVLVMGTGHARSLAAVVLSSFSLGVAFAVFTGIVSALDRRATWRELVRTRYMELTPPQRAILMRAYDEGQEGRSYVVQTDEMALVREMESNGVLRYDEYGSSENVERYTVAMGWNCVAHAARRTNAE